MKLEPLENEKWVWAKTFKGDYPNYLVSDMGRCWSIKRNKFVGYWDDEHWYVGLSKKNKPENIMIGRLILISFGVPIPEHLQGLPTSKLQSMHLDGNSKNNSLSNFQWGDAKENNNEENYRIRNSEARKGKLYSEEHRKKLSEARKGKHHSEEAKRKIGEALKGDNHPMYGKYGKDNPKSKSVIQYSKEGILIKEWGSIIDAQKELGVDNSGISKCARGKQNTAGGYIWRYK